jgi:hypothetical protein
MTNSGHLYVLINPTLRTNCYKIGKTNRDPHERARELSSGTGVATPYEVAYQKFFEDVDYAESKVHFALRLNRISGRREFFDVKLHEAIQVIEAVAQGETPEPVKQVTLDSPNLATASMKPVTHSRVTTDSSERACFIFWEALLEAGKQQSLFWERFRPTNYQWITSSLPSVPKATYYIIVNKTQIHMELVFTTGKDSPNIEIYERLLARREEVEATFGQKFEWKLFPKTSKVKFVSGHGCYQERPDWPRLIPPTVQHFEPFWNVIHKSLEI